MSIGCAYGSAFNSSSFPGSQELSFGLCSDGKLYWNSNKFNFTTPFGKDDVIGCGVVKNEYIYYTKNGTYLGKAFDIREILAQSSANRELLYGLYNVEYCYIPGRGIFEMRYQS